MKRYFVYCSHGYSLEADVDETGSYVFYEDVKAELDALRQQLEDAQCCGNCDYFESKIKCPFYKANMFQSSRFCYCPSHTPDKLSRKERSE